jgi:hypothetical protein
VGDAADPARVTESAAAALARRTASSSSSPAASAAIIAPLWASPAPVVSTAATAGAGILRAASPAPVEIQAPRGPSRSTSAAFPARPGRMRARTASGAVVPAISSASRKFIDQTETRGMTSAMTFPGISAASGPGSTTKRTLRSASAIQAAIAGPSSG